MNNVQQKYLRERLQKLTRLKIDKLQKQYPDELLNAKQRVQALKEGRFELIDVEDYGYNAWYSYVKFLDEKTNSKLRADKQREIQRDADLIMDQLMLGEEAGLLEALRAFEEKEF